MYKYPNNQCEKSKKSVENLQKNSHANAKFSKQQKVTKTLFAHITIDLNIKHKGKYV